MAWNTARAVLGAALAGGVALAAVTAGNAADGEKTPAASVQETVQGAGAPAEAVFAGGCFWCMEPPFDKLDGVMATTSGYAGGSVPNPTYEQVSFEDTGHKEVVRVTYDPARVSYETLLETYWVNVDPFDARGQFCDKGDSYKAVIFWADRQQKALAEASRALVEERLGRPVVTAVEPLETFWPAEDYHQDYYRTTTLKYKFYRFSCGRDARLDEIWEGHRPLDLDLAAVQE